MIPPILLRDVDRILEDIDDMSDSLSLNSDACSVDVAIRLDVVVGHMCMAWYRRNMSIDEALAIETRRALEVFIQIPNWEERFRLVSIPLTFSNGTGAKIKCDYDFDPAVFKREMNKGSQFLRNFVKNDNVEFEAELEHVLADTLSGLCLGWHMAHLGTQVRELLDSQVLGKLSVSLPKWDGRYELVPAH